MKQRKRLCLIAALALGVSLPLAWSGTAVVRTKNANATRTNSVVLIPLLQGGVLATKPPQLSPGIYSTAPYSMLVLVPERIARSMAYAPDMSRFNMPSLPPATHLEKR